MVKLRTAPTLCTYVMAAWFLCGIASCSSAPSKPTSSGAPLAPGEIHTMLSPSATPARPARKLWSHKVTGLMTDLTMSDDGSAILVATIPNPDAVSGPRETGHGLTRFDRSGKKRWRVDMPGVIKAMALSDDGKVAVVSTYDNQITGIDERGKTVWKVEGMCRPIPVGKRFLCYHDDDAEPEVAFDVYDAKGHKVLIYPVTRDVLALKVSADDRNVVLAVDGGQLSLLGTDFKSLWQRSVEGEVVDLAVTAGAQPRVAVLFTKEAKQGIAFFAANGDKLGEATPVGHVEQIGFTPDGKGLGAYGNGVAGQFVAYYETPQTGASPVIAEKWHHADSHAADFSSALVVSGFRGEGLVMVGFEDVSASTRRSYLLVYDPSGALQWSIPLVTDEGAYLYAHGFAPKPAMLAVGTDDGTLSAFSLTAP